jgi:hypothetical protein
MAFRTHPILLILALAGLYSWANPSLLVAQEQDRDVAVLQLRLIDGDGAVHRPGSKSSVPLTVQAIDEVGRPVSGVTVSFLMPGYGPAGIFASGLSTEVLSTGADGRATVYGIRWGNATGQVRIRIIARKGGARAGLVSTQYVEAVESAESTAPSVSKPRTKWIAIAIAAAGAAAGGLALGIAGSGGGSSTPAAGAIEEPPDTSSTVQVGPPTISIGAP